MRQDYLRVTNILYPFSGLDKINPEVLAHAANRGTKVHKICEGIMSGLGEYGIEEETQGYIDSFKLWWEQGHKIVLMEKRFWCDVLKITGQVDLVLDTQEGLAILDLKTSSKPSKTWQIQGCAYAYLAKEAGYDIKKIYFLHLNRYGKPPKIYEYPVDASFFLPSIEHSHISLHRRRSARPKISRAAR